MALVLRVCKSDFTSRDGFTWPSEVGAVVTTPDWDDRKVCGSGLHGWLHGQGDVTCVNHWQDADARWFVLEVETFVELDGKVKFPSAVVRFVGEKKDAAAYLLEHDPEAGAVIGLSLDVGDNAVAVAGGLSTLTGGHGSTLTGGYDSTLTGGDYSTLTGGYDSTLTGGNRSTLTFAYWDGRKRLVTAYTGEDGIKANTPYKLNDEHKPIEVTQRPPKPCSPATKQVVSTLQATSASSVA